MTTAITIKTDSYNDQKGQSDVQENLSPTDVT